MCNNTFSQTITNVESQIIFSHFYQKTQILNTKIAITKNMEFKLDYQYLIKMIKKMLTISFQPKKLGQVKFIK